MDWLVETDSIPIPVGREQAQMAADEQAVADAKLQQVRERLLRFRWLEVVLLFLRCVTRFPARNSKR
jgi:hypothetical protein